MCVSRARCLDKTQFAHKPRQKQAEIHDEVWDM